MKKAYFAGVVVFVTVGAGAMVAACQSGRVGTTHSSEDDEGTDQDQGEDQNQDTPPPAFPPDAPTDLDAVVGNATVSLSFIASARATGHRVYRRDGDAISFVQIGADLAADAHAYDDGAVTNNTTYAYVVRAFNEDGESTDSDLAYATPHAWPGIPWDFAATPGEGQVTLIWTSATDATGHRVYRDDTSGGPYSQVGGDLGADASSFEDDTVKNDFTYYYIVAAFNAFGDETESIEVEVMPVSLPDAPTHLARTPADGSVTLTWVPPAAADAQRVYRSETKGGPYTQVGGDLDGDADETTDASAINAAIYYYVVRAVNAAGESEDSSAVRVRPPKDLEICVSAPGNGSLLAFDALADGDEAPLRRYGSQTDLASPIAIELDADRDEIITGNYRGGITVHVRTASGNVASLHRVYVDNVVSAMAFDSVHDEVFAASLSSVAVYAWPISGTDEPVRTISGADTLLNVALGLTVDTVNNEIYATDRTANRITVYDRTDNGNTAPKRTITGVATLLNDPLGLVVDQVNDRLIVSNYSPRTITVYERTASGDVAPLREIKGGSTGIDRAWSIAIDLTHNELILANNNGQTVTVYDLSKVYDSAETSDLAPLRTLGGSNTQLSGPNDVAVDLAADEILVADSSDAILVFDRDANGNVAPKRRVSAAMLGLKKNKSLAVDATSGEIYVSNFYGTNVAVFPLSLDWGTEPIRTIAGAATGFTYPIRIALDSAHDELFVTDYSGAVFVFAQDAWGDVAPVRSIKGDSTGIAYPWAIALDATNDEVFVGNYYGKINVFTRDASGDVAPARMIVVAENDAGGIAGLALDLGANELFVSNTPLDAWDDPSKYQIRVYARTASGTDLPSRTIEGLATGLKGPQAIAFDATFDEIYIANSGGYSITVYAADASGDVAPRRTIKGPATALIGPEGVALCSP